MKILKTEIARLKKMSLCEKRIASLGFSKIAGIDEAGRGPLAGPVVAAACILPKGALLENLNDSKKLNATQREKLFSQIISLKGVCFGIGISTVLEIDQYNILKATFLAMHRAVSALSLQPDYLLIDGKHVPSFGIPSEAIVGGDSKSVSIAAASILAKVTRDKMMLDLHDEFPVYGFNRHKGYGTEEHIKAILAHGPSSIHRKSFDPIRSILSPPQPELI